jgi:hypothetical protein
MSMLVFQSDRFRPYLPDECQVNPNVLGFELAAWLSRELASHGWVTSYPNNEDWGWFIEGEEAGAEYMICCSGSDEGDGQFEWRVFVSQPKKLFGKKPAGTFGDRILGRVQKVVEESGITTEVQPD